MALGILHEGIHAHVQGIRLAPRFLERPPRLFRSHCRGRGKKLRNDESLIRTREKKKKIQNSVRTQPYWGLDMRRGLESAWDLHGQYSTDVFTKEAVRLIDNHNTSRPMFLYLSHAAVHSGNPYNPLPAHDHDVAKFPKILDYNRRRFAGN